MKQKHILLLAITFMALLACKKESEASDDQDSGSNKRLTDIVPQTYLDEAKKMGFPIHTGDNPPVVTGSWRLAPWRLDADNAYTGTGTAPGTTNQTGFSVGFAAQTPESITVSYTGYYEGVEIEKPFIMGSGNNFTVCRYIGMDACGANFRYNYMQMISGTKDGNVLKNVKMATICLKAVNPNATCKLDGNIVIHSDVDAVSTQ